MPALNKVIEILRETRPMMRDYAEILAHRDNIGYFRPCQPDESMADIHAEAAENGAIVASKGDVVCIMPRLADGWVLVNGMRRAA